MSVPNLLRLTLHWSGLGEEGDVSAWFAHAPSMYSEGDLSAALAAIDTAMATSTTPSTWTGLQGLLITTQSYDDLALYQYPDAPGPSGVLSHRTPSPARAGTQSGSHPLQVAGVVSVGTGSASRRRKGRMYMPAHCVAIDSTLQFGATACAAINNAATGFLADSLAALRATLSGGDPIRHVVFSRAGGFVTDSTALITDSRPDIQRRRANKQQSIRQSVTNHVNPTS